VRIPKSWLRSFFRVLRVLTMVRAAPLAHRRRPATAVGESLQVDASPPPLPGGLPAQPGRAHLRLAMNPSLLAPFSLPISEAILFPAGTVPWALLWGDVLWKKFQGRLPI